MDEISSVELMAEVLQLDALSFINLTHLFGRVTSLTCRATSDCDLDRTGIIENQSFSADI